MNETTQRIHVATHSGVDIYFDPADGQFHAQPTPTGRERVGFTIGQVRAEIDAVLARRAKAREAKPFTPVDVHVISYATHDNHGGDDPRPKSGVATVLGLTHAKYAGCGLLLKFKGEAEWKVGHVSAMKFLPVGSPLIATMQRASDAADAAKKAWDQAETARAEALMACATWLPRGHHGYSGSTNCVGADGEILALAKIQAELAGGLAECEARERKDVP